MASDAVEIVEYWDDIEHWIEIDGERMTLYPMIPPWCDA